MENINKTENGFDATLTHTGKLKNFLQKNNDIIKKLKFSLSEDSENELTFKITDFN